MNKAKVLKAVGLFYITEEMIDMKPSDPKFQALYDMECELFGLLTGMTEGESQAYQKLIDHGSVLG
jgi:hypothetical protein